MYLKEIKIKKENSGLQVYVDAFKAKTILGDAFAATMECSLEHGVHNMFSC